jgi:hypothetical protein
VEYTRSELDLSKGKRCQSVNAGNFGSATCCFDLDKKDYCLKITAWTNSATGKTSKMKEKTICMQPKLDELLEKLG